MRPDLGLLNLRLWSRRLLPVKLQNESAECGLACLVMIAWYWGYRTDLAALRRRFSVSTKGATLQSLIKMGRAMALSARPLKVELEHLAKLTVPCILHWDMNHFVVLRRVNGRHIHVHDPAVGHRKMTLEEASRHFTGIALEMAPAADFRSAEVIRSFTLRSLMGRIVGLKRGLTNLFALGVGLQICLLVAPFYLQWMVDEAVVAADRELITVLGLGFLFLAVIHAAISAIRSWMATALATSLNFQWLSNVFSHLMSLPIAYFEKRHLGDIVSRFGSIQTIQRTITTQYVEAVLDGILAIATLVVMLLFSLPLAAIACCAVLAYALLRAVLFRKSLAASAEQIVHSAKQQSHLLASARGVQSIRLFGREEERRIGWTNALAEELNADLRVSRMSIVFQTANLFLFATERIVVVWLAVLFVLDLKFSIGMLFAFMSYKEQFSQRLVGLVDKYFEFKTLRVHGERVADIVLSEPEVNEAVEVELNDIRPTLELRNVSFRYADDEPFVLMALNLSISAGECIAITGVSGCGKTTLLKLMLGLLEPTNGAILLGGRRVEHVGVRNFRKLVGTVMQEDYLFSGSIAENISFFDPSADSALIEEAAVRAAIHDEIAAMPMGYNTLIGDVGSGLSGGQRQRILLARALYKNPLILFLDEATSHLDVDNERRVNSSIRRLDLTRIIVAHRTETIEMADRVVVLEEGRIVRDLRNTVRLA